MNVLPTLIAGLIAITLVGCAANTTPVPPCCYEGAVTTTRIGALELRTENGTRMKFIDALPGFEPEDGLFTTALPFEEVESQDFVFASLKPLLATYDANRDTRLERPELIALYAREAIRAAGTAVRHLGGDTPIWAVSAPPADVGGLVNWARVHRSTMNRNGQMIFRDLERLGLDLKTRGSEDNGDQDWED